MLWLLKRSIGESGYGEDYLFLILMGRPVSLATKDRDLVDYYAIANMEVEVAQDFAEVQKQEIYHYCKEKHFI